MTERGAAEERPLWIGRWVRRAGGGRGRRAPRETWRERRGPPARAAQRGGGLGSTIKQGLSDQVERQKNGIADRLSVVAERVQRDGRRPARERGLARQPARQGCRGAAGRRRRDLGATNAGHAGFGRGVRPPAACAVHGCDRGIGLRTDALRRRRTDDRIYGRTPVRRCRALDVPTRDPDADTEPIAAAPGRADATWPPGPTVGGSNI